MAQSQFDVVPVRMTKFPDQSSMLLFFLMCQEQNLILKGLKYAGRWETSSPTAENMV